MAAFNFPGLKDYNDDFESQAPSFAERISFGANGAAAADTNAPYTVDSTFGLFDQADSNGVQTQKGLFNPVMNGVTGAFNIYAGLKGLSQQEDALDFQKDAFNKNFAANKAAFQENLRSKYGRKATLGGHKNTTEKEFVDKRSDF